MAAERTTITERDRRVINFVTRLSDEEIFGLECFLAGTRVAKKETAESKQKTEATPA